MSLFTKLYDKVMYPFEKKYISMIRRKILKDSNGKILEVGVGTGANFPFYPEGVHITGVEPSKEMLKQAEEKLGNKYSNVKLILGNAENLPFLDNSFDTVVATLVLCSVQDLEKSLLEMQRVLKPDGKIILFEHIRLDDPRWVGKLQDIFTPPWALVCDGCHLNRNTVEEARKYFQFHQYEKYFRNLFVTAVGENRKKY